VSKSRRHWLWITPLVMVLTPVLLFVYASWRYPLRTGAILMAVYQRLPSSLRNNDASWNLVNAYLRATVEDGQPLEAKRELRRHKRPDYLVVALGDSVTAGENVDPVARWTFLLQNLMHYRLRKSVRVVNSGIAGEIAPLGLTRLDRDVLALKPDLVVVGYLINDGRIFGVGAEGQGQTMVSFDEFLNTMQTIVAKVRGTGAAVLVFTCQPIQPGFFGFQHMDWATLQEIMFTARVTALKGLAARYGVPLSDTYEAIAAMTDQVTLYDADNIHLNADGHKLIAQLIFQTWAEKFYPSLAAPRAPQP